MKKILLPFLALMLAACGHESASTADTASLVADNIMSRRSIRQYQPRAISRDTLDLLVRHGINAPNGRNRQSYEIRIVDNPELLSEISAAVLHDNPSEGNKNGSIFFGAPCVIFLANDTQYDMSQVDCGLLGENIILSAWSMGIGSCCAAHPVRLMKESPSCAPLIERLGFSKDFNLLYSIALGFPDESPDARPRKYEMAKYIE